jgi:cell division FtsZ-interacting protein ZapD
MISLEKLKQMRVCSYLLSPPAPSIIQDLIDDLEQQNRTITALIDRQRVDAKVIADLEGQIERLEGKGFEESGV